MPYELPDILEPDGTLELCVKIPNRPEYIRAFLASYSYLTRWVAWERDALNSASIAAGYFLEAYNQTIDQWQNCQGTGDEEVTIINNYVDVNCGCSDGGVPSTIYCVLQDGTPVITPQPPAPTEPTPPPGGEFPLDPGVDPPPDGFEDWTEFDDRACFASNIMWYWAKWLVVTLETLGDVLAIIATAVTLVAPLLPAGVLAAIGGVVLLDILWQLIQILAAEQASDILLEIEDWLDEHRQELVCKVYSHRYDYKFALEIADGLGDYVAQSVLMSPSERNAVETFITKVFAFQMFAAVIAGELAETFGLSTEFPLIDCSTCGTGSFLFFDNFGTDTTGGVGWDDVRADAPAGYAHLNAIPGNPSRIFLPAGLWDTYWGLPVDVTGTGTRLRLNWQVLERNSGTHVMDVKVKRKSDNTLVSVALLSTFVSGVPIGAWQSVDVYVPFDVALDSAAGQSILWIEISTTSSRLRVAVDNVRFEGQTA